MKSIPSYGKLMTLKEFIENVKSGCFVNYDGYGYYSDGKEMSDELVRPSDVRNGGVNDKWTHVVWFNR